MNSPYPYEDKVIALIKQDEMRLKALDCVFQLKLPQCYIAAGFVRNLVWDHLHNKSPLTTLNDIDVIYFDPENTSIDDCIEYENTLNSMMPELNWEVRNQAQMHTRNGDSPYFSSVDAMGHWPEKETAVAIQKVDTDQYACLSAFGFQSLFERRITYNQKRARSIFDNRVKAKSWLIHWPDLSIA